MKEYTLDAAQAVANDLSDISLFLNSTSCRENEALQAIIWERLQSQIEHLQSLLSFIQMQPTLKAEQIHQSLN
ncbi:DNA polymerase III subunit alpha [Vibrio cholerae]|uniref:DNA polymerase III subunit alpha n=1 Tax=Vibrio cholerae TaxID=666 RepID=UPI001E49FE6A|nr:DNA polymerase III subunit alpha [Vibrio cholerae]MCD6678471.1 DNA polymerase III subunit alpha [Vibrio cholerae]